MSTCVCMLCMYVYAVAAETGIEQVEVNAGYTTDNACMRQSKLEYVLTSDVQRARKTEIAMTMQLRLHGHSQATYPWRAALQR